MYGTVPPPCDQMNLMSGTCATAPVCRTPRIVGGVCAGVAERDGWGGDGTRFHLREDLRRRPVLQRRLLHAARGGQRVEFRNREVRMRVDPERANRGSACSLCGGESRTPNPES